MQFTLLLLVQQLIVWPIIYQAGGSSHHEIQDSYESALPPIILIDLLDHHHPALGLKSSEGIGDQHQPIAHNASDRGSRQNSSINNNISSSISLLQGIQWYLPSDMLMLYSDYHTQANNFHPLMLFTVSIGMTIDRGGLSPWALSLMRDLHYLRIGMMLHVSFSIDGKEYFVIRVNISDSSSGGLNETIVAEHVIQSDTRIDRSLLKASLRIKSMNHTLSHELLERALNEVDEYSTITTGNGEADLVRIKELALSHGLYKLLQVHHLKISYCPQPDKVSLPLLHVGHRTLLDQSSDKDHPSPAHLMMDGRDSCSLLGVSHAVVLNKLSINSSYALDSSSSSSNSSSSSDYHGAVGGVRLLCSIYSTASNHDTRVRAQRQTWGRHCSHFLVFSTATDMSIPSIRIPHLGEESYRNLWQKVRFIWKYIHRHYIEDFDWFLLSGDDTYVVVENLVEYLSSPEIVSERRKNQGVYLGRQLVNPYLDPPLPFNSGGAGYVLDSNAVRVLHHNSEAPHCGPIGLANEDTMLAMCLRDSLNKVLPYNNSSDDLNEQRFHIFTPGFHYLYKKTSSQPSVNDDWYSYYDEHIREGLSCCSTKSISFHYISADLMYEIHNYLYSCPNERKVEYYQSKPGAFAYFEFHDPLSLRIEP